LFIISLFKFKIDIDLFEKKRLSPLSILVLGRRRGRRTKWSDIRACGLCCATSCQRYTTARHGGRLYPFGRSMTHALHRASQGSAATNLKSSYLGVYLPNLLIFFSHNKLVNSNCQQTSRRVESTCYMQMIIPGYMQSFTDDYYCARTRSSLLSTRDLSIAGSQIFHTQPPVLSAPSLMLYIEHMYATSCNLV